MVAAAVVGLGVLAACAVGREDVASQGTVQTEQVEAAPALPSAGAEDPQDPATWVITSEAVGVVRLGDDLGTALDAVPGDWDDGACPSGATWHSAPYDFDIAVEAGATSGIGAIAVTGAIGVPSDAPQTPEGLGLGSTRDEVRAAHPTAEETMFDDGSVVIRAADDDPSDGALAFRVDAASDRVDEILVTLGEAQSAEVCG